LNAYADGRPVALIRRCNLPRAALQSADAALLGLHAALDAMGVPA
jgi:hypothetical protein